MFRLVIRQIDKSDPPQFLLVRLEDGKSTDGVEVPSPVGFAVEIDSSSPSARETSLGSHRRTFCGGHRQTRPRFGPTSAQPSPPVVFEAPRSKQ